jgi:2,4-dienoyl-CoA reductase-like NADH-dependent reductase (Old Yellow Enzyme family)
MVSSTSINLFKPIQLGNKTLKHRVAMAPLTRFRADDNHVPTDLSTTYYDQRASDGGLIITEATFISEEAGHYPNVPGIWSNDQIKAWKKITDAVHAKGGIIYLQLWHLGRADGVPNVSASAIALTAEQGKEPNVPRALETSEIPRIVEQYKQAALNSIEAGFDGVEIHAANGYLLDQFLQSNSNKRTDKYGGSAENRARIVLETIHAVTNAVGEDRTGVRFSPYSHFQEMHDANPVETFSVVTQSIQDRFPNLSYLHFVEPRISGDNDTSPDSALSLKPFHDIWTGVFLRAGGLTLQSAVAAAEEHEKNVLVFGRAFLANPDLPLRLKNEWELNRHNRDTFYVNKSPIGYIDYPFYSENAEA